jgi:predicted RNA-binding protein YlqC (UPF0109 family)
MESKKDQEFLEFVVKAIVENPDAVVVERRVDEMGVLLELKVDPLDMGKIIGKDGRTAKAVRTLLRVIGAQTNARINLKIVEPEGSTRAHTSSYNDEEARQDDAHAQAAEETAPAPTAVESSSFGMDSDLDELAS